MTFRRFHAFSLRFTGVFRPNNRLAEAAKSCHDLLMQDRLIVLALLATAACTSASAQIAQPLADGSGSAQILPLLDLNGEWWGDERGSIFNRYVPKARIEHQGKDFSVIEATENVPYYGQKFLGGSYSGETSFLLLRYPLSNPPRHVRITINDPDTVVIGGGTHNKRYPLQFGQSPSRPSKWGGSAGGCRRGCKRHSANGLLGVRSCIAGRCASAILHGPCPAPGNWHGAELRHGLRMAEEECSPGQC
jgi:hypothetical protein